MSYDGIAVFGCSFMAGSNILDSKGKIDVTQRMSWFLSKELGVREFNNAWPGSGNTSIIRTTYEWLEKQNVCKNPLVVIGTSGISRKELYNSVTNVHWNNHMFDWAESDDDPDKIERRRRALNEDISTEDFLAWVKVEQRIFSLKYEYTAAERNYSLLTSYLNHNNIDYIIFNSLMDVLGKVKKQNNYLSFNIQSEGELYRSNDFASKDYRLESRDDCWYHYLRDEHIKKFGEYNNNENRSSIPPHGEYFCGGHPSPEANKQLTQRILNKL